MSFRLVPILMTLNDLERRNGPYFALFLPNLVVAAYFALFQRTRVRCRRKTISRLISVSKSTFDSL